MKRIIIAVAIVCAAVFAQAASVSWTSGTLYNDTGAKVGASATMYVYLLDQKTYDGLTDVWGTYGADVLAGGTTAANVGGTATGKYTHKANVQAPNGTAIANTTYYAAMIVTIGSGADMKYYAEKASVTTGDDANGSFTTFGDGKINSSTTAMTAWTPAVSTPEPTSGLLFLLGMAGLALKRKRA